MHHPKMTDCGRSRFCGRFRWLRLILAFHAFSWCQSQFPFDPVDEAATVEFERYSQVHESGADSASDPDYRRYSMQCFFPAGRLGNRELFGGLRGEIFDRIYRDGNAALNSRLLNRHSLTLGGEVVKRPGQESFLMATLGYNGDLESSVGSGLSSEWIYAHNFTAGPRCKWGLGLDVLGFSGEWRPYPLVFLEWWMFDRTKLRINADLAEVRQFLGSRFCLSLGTRYNLSYGTLGKDMAFSSESLAWEGGAEFSFARNLLLKFKLKRAYWGEDRFTPKTRPEYSGGLESGNSLKVSVAYAP